MEPSKQALPWGTTDAPRKTSIGLSCTLGITLPRLSGVQEFTWVSWCCRVEWCWKCFEWCRKKDITWVEWGPWEDITWVNHFWKRDGVSILQRGGGCMDKTRGI